MDKIIREAEKICYSDKDIKNLLDGNVLIYTYNNLEQILQANGAKATLDTLLQDKDCVCILYLVPGKTNFGHWTSILKDSGGEHCYEIFDSYGIFPDDQLKYMSGYDPSPLKKTLSRIVQNTQRVSGVPIYFNKYPLQSGLGMKGTGINTCGRWCAVRCSFKRFNIREFIAMFINQSQPPDVLVTYLTILSK